jgi:hypothetical protein
MSSANGEEAFQKIVKFLVEELARDKGRMCIRISLIAAPSGYRGAVLKEWNREEDPDRFQGMGNFEALAGEILQIADNNANAGGGRLCRYVLSTTQVHGGGSKYAFKREGEGEDGDGFMPEAGDEGPTASGMLAQQMRHNEVYMRMQTGMVNTILSTLANQNRELADDNHNLRKAQSTQFNELEAARSRADERALAGQLAVQADERKTHTLDGVMKLLPVIASKFMGEQGLPAGGASNPIVMILNDFADSISQEQIMAIAQSPLLSMAQKLQLQQLIEAARLAKLQEEQSQAGQQTASG